MDTQGVINEVREILSGWRGPADKRGAERMCGRAFDCDDLIVDLTPAGWLIVGVDPHGRTHSGCRADAIDLAHDLARISRALVYRPSSMVHVEAPSAGADSLVPLESAPIFPGVFPDDDWSLADDGENGEVCSPGDQAGASAIGEADTVQAATDDLRDEAQSAGYGVALEQDAIARLRAKLIVEIDALALNRIREFAPNTEETRNRELELRQKQFLKLASEAELTELARFDRRASWIQETTDWARMLKEQVEESALDELEIFDLDGWPEPPA